MFERQLCGIPCVTPVSRWNYLCRRRWHVLDLIGTTLQPPFDLDWPRAVGIRGDRGTQLRLGTQWEIGVDECFTPDSNDIGMPVGDDGLGLVSIDDETNGYGTNANLGADA